MEIPSLTLNSGNKMPLIGLGTWKVRPAINYVFTVFLFSFLYSLCCKLFNEYDYLV